MIESRRGPAVACWNERALLVDRFETTRGAWRRWYAGEGEARDAAFEAWIARWTPDTDDWPASFMTQGEALRFASSRGMRLLTAREWLRVACGTRALSWPWGQGQASSVANTLDLGLSRPLPVGTFEQGRTPLATYDMLGNVWEWVDEPIADPPDGESAPLAWAMGGSFLSRLRRLYEFDSDHRLSFQQQDLDPGTRSSDLGLRCAADAEEWLSSRAASWGEGAEARARLEAIGARWGRDAIPLLEALTSRPGAPRSLAWLLDGARR